MSDYLPMDVCPQCGKAVATFYSVFLPGATKPRICYGCHACQVHTTLDPTTATLSDQWHAIRRAAVCQHCHALPYRHVEGKCLFSSTNYEPWT